jgi:hypothetical protein
MRGACCIQALRECLLATPSLALNIMFENILAGFSVLLDGWPIVAALGGLALGVVVGAIPGLTATMTIAILMPFTFFLPPAVAIGFLLGIYKGAVYGGSIPAVLINTPGTAAAAATCLDGSVLAKSGQAKKALQMSLYASVVGDLLSTILLIAVAVFGCAMALFAVSTHFWLSMLALAISGAADTVSVVIRMTLMQLETPDEMRGRVGAVNSIFIGASNELGEFESGAAAAWLGPVMATLVGGLGTILVAVMWLRLFPKLAQRDKLE